MPTYTLCPLYVNKVCNDNEDFVNVLFKFCQNNNLKVGLDSTDYLITSYESLLSKNELFRTWIKFLFLKENNYEILPTNEEYDNIHSATIDTCVKSYDRILSCKIKNDYNDKREQIQMSSITLIDADELRTNISNGNTFITNQINQTSHGNNAGNTINNR